MQMILDSQIWAKPETEPKIYNLYKTSKSKKVKKMHIWFRSYSHVEAGVYITFGHTKNPNCFYFIVYC